MARLFRDRHVLVLAALGLAATASAITPACSCGDEETLQTEQPVFVVDTDPLRIDFGAVEEHTFELRSVDISNPGRVELHVTPTISPDGSQEFSTPPLVVTVGAGASGQVEVQYNPEGPGEDDGVLVLASDDPNTPQILVDLHGGPIFPRLVGDPDPVTFAAPLPRTPRKNVSLRNDGLADLHITSIGVDPAGNPDFSITPPTIPDSIRPGDELVVEVVYARSTRSENGAMLVLSDDPDDDENDGARSIPLVAVALGACGNGVDDDGDTRIDWPDDPGCEGPDDDNELNPAVCQPGAQQPCGTDEGECRAGLFICDDFGQFGPCTGEIGPEDEACDGLDNDCDGDTDEEVTETCNAGACAGARLCEANTGLPVGTWGDCFPVGATQEVCDNADNDCDGQADEGIVENCVLTGGCAGERICIPGTGTFTDCQPDASSQEVCDGIDNDCDGSIDENPRPTTCGIGVCERTVTGCTNGVPDVCQPGNPTLEACNNLDDDCNGFVDDGIPNTNCGVGECRSQAVGCLNGTAPVCTPGAPMPEVCNNGLDEDCDSQIDNGCGVACDPDGTWIIDQGTISYACCFGITGYDIPQFTFSQDASRCLGQGGPPTMRGAMTSCPVGSFSQTITLAGGCSETYTLTGSFTSDDTWTGTFEATFVGPDCNCFGVAGEECLDQSHAITATRQ